MKINRGKKQRPRRTLLYGPHGIGKSSWAASAPDTVFLNIEDGLDDIDCASTEKIIWFSQVIDMLNELNADQMGFRHVAIDSLDWLERLIHRAVAKDKGVGHISEIGYGAGYKSALPLWGEMFSKLDMLRNEHGIGIILLAHAEAKRHESPDNESYDRYQPALHSAASAAIQEWCDEVLFASYRVYTRQEEQGFNKTRNIGIGSGERFIRTQESAAVIAKNRLGLPAELPMPQTDGYAVYSQYFQKSQIDE